MTQYKTQYGTIFAVKEHNGAPAIMCRAELSETWSLSSMITPFTPGAWTAEELQGQLNSWAATKDWQPVAEPASAEPPLPMPGDVYQAPQSGQLYKIGELTNGKKTCYLTMRSNAQSSTWVPANSSVYPNLSDAQGEFEAWIRREQLEPVAPTMDAAAIMDELAAKDPFKAEGISTTSASGADAGTSLPGSSCKSAPNFSPAPDSPADAGAAEQNLPAVGSASLAAEDTDAPAFDYSGLDDQTVADLHLAEREYMSGRKLAEVGLRRMADGVAMAHDALCGCDNLSQAHNNQHSEKTFGAWCDSVGLNRKAAERLLQVARLFDSSTPREEKVLEDLGPSLLYAAAKPSAPAELVQAVKAGDITTHKQYQELLAQLKAAQSDKAAAERKVTQFEEMKDSALETARQAQEDAASAESRARAAENRASGAQKLAEQRGSENTELKAKIRELENQPRDVAVVQPGEDQIEAWRREGADRMAATMRDTVRQANQEKLQAQNQVADLQEQLATARPDADACQRTVDTLYETAENLRMLLRSQLKQAQLPPSTYGQVVAHVLLIAHALLDTVRLCAPDGYDMDSEEDDDFA